MNTILNAQGLPAREVRARRTVDDPNRFYTSDAEHVFGLIKFRWRSFRPWGRWYDGVWSPLYPDDYARLFPRRWAVLRALTFLADFAVTLRRGLTRDVYFSHSGRRFSLKWRSDFLCALWGWRTIRRMARSRFRWYHDSRGVRLLHRLLRVEAPT